MKFAFPPESRPLDGFTIKRAIYRGGFGEVYYGLSDAGREVALKLLQNNTEIELRGVQQCLNLSHPNLVTIFDVRQDAEGDHWIIMEYVSGSTLEQTMRGFPQGMPVEMVRHWLHGLTAGTQYLHDQGLVHRDLKPANIFLEGSTVKIGDVGLSKFIHPSTKSAHTQSVGTVYYMAPEVAKGRYGKPVDIYATGVMLYEMLTGNVPFDGESTGEILMKHLTELPDLKKLPPRLQPVIGKALHKDANLRFASMDEFQRAFDSAVTGRELSTGEKVNWAGVGCNSKKRHQWDKYGHYDRKWSQCKKWEKWDRSSLMWLFVGSIMVGAVTGLMPLILPFAVLGLIGMAGYRALGAMFSGGAASLDVAADRLNRGADGMDRFMNHVIGDWPFIGRAALAGAIFTSLFAVGAWQHPHVVPRLFTIIPAVLFLVAWSYRRRSPANVAAEPAPVVMPRHQEVAALPRSNSGALMNAAFVAVPFAGLLSAVFALLKPGFFSLTKGSETLDPAAAGLFAAIAVLAIWALLLCHYSARKFRVSALGLIFAGVVVGLAASRLTDYLMITFPTVSAFQTKAIFRQFAGHRLMNGSTPTPIGFAIFFASLFWLRNWASMIRPWRKNRFRIGSVIKTIFAAWLITLVFAFPLPWALGWAAVLACTVQLASPWEPESTHPHAERMN